MPQATAAADSTRPEFLAWLREATGWQRIGRLVPLSWIAILVWPLMLLLTRGLRPEELAVSLLGVGTFAVVWAWFWLQPRTGTDPWLSLGVLVGLGAIGAALTLAVLESGMTACSATAWSWRLYGRPGGPRWSPFPPWRSSSFWLWPREGRPRSTPLAWPWSGCSWVAASSPCSSC